MDTYEVFIDPETGAERYAGILICNGMCLNGYGILYPIDGVSATALAGVAYPHPMCPLHGEGEAWPDEEALRVACENTVDGLAHAYSEGVTW